MKMPFPQQIKNLFRPNSNKPMDLEEVFELVYGRKPSRNEIVLLRGLTRDVPKSDQMNIFRAVINGFDHQSLNTPFTVRFSSRDVEYVPVEHFELAIDKQDISVSAPLKQGEYELHLLEFFRERLKPGMTFIDIGANVGLYSMFAARIVGGNGKVFSFEPNSENCRLIMLSKYRNEFENVTVYPMALGKKQVMLFFPHISVLTEDSLQILKKHCGIQVALLSRLSGFKILSLKELMRSRWMWKGPKAW